ncbi:MAG: DegT/DnrJ/EryC1/StrS family aminotransferase [Patescibacteria group bacterium]
MPITDINPYNTSYIPEPRAHHNETTLDNLLTQYFGTKTAVVSSARAGIHLILSQLGLTKQDHILIPDFLCRSVLYILNLQGFAVQQADARTKAIFVLHQWGYPQRMDIIMAEAKKRGWFVIEDCAHTFGGTYHGQILGSFGDASVISIPKFFPTYVGGAIISQRDDMITRVRKMRRDPRSLGHFAFDRISVWAARQFYLLRNPPFLFNAICIKCVSFPRIPTIALRRFPRTVEDLKTVIARRRYIFETLKKQASPNYYPDHLEEGSDVIPLCMPIFFPEAKLSVAQEMLKKKNIKVDILHFDVNRNVLDPRYIKCLAFPCHQYVTEEELHHMCDVIRHA